MKTAMNRSLVILLLATAGCAAERQFPLRDPLTHDPDMRAVNVRCHKAPSKKDANHISCAPKEFVSSLYWDGADNLVFRPLSEALGVVTSAESVNVNSFDEVADSSWFTNRIATVTEDELKRGACKPEQMLDADAAADGTWVIDRGKMDGSTPGFRVDIPGKGKFMLKIESVDDAPERQSAGAVIGASIYHAVGYNISCEQLLYVKRSTLKLTPGLRSKANFQPEKPFDQETLDKLLTKAVTRDGRIRVSASAWLTSLPIGPYRWYGTRDDDPNDVVRHEDRRELRGMRVLASWLGRTDGREANSLDAWVADNKKVPDSSPGHVLHYQLDVSETLGATWDFLSPEVSRRIGSSYLVDWGDIGRDFITLGIPIRPWEDLKKVPGHELFGYYELDHYQPDHWKNEYPNIAWTHMSERDGAWMARILARFTPQMIHTLALVGNFTDPSQSPYLESVMEGRLERVLERYLLSLSPLSDVHVEGSDKLCATDLAEWRGMRDPSSFHYAARTEDKAALDVTRGERGAICVALKHFAADGGAPDDARSRYVRIVIEDGVARGKMIAHLYDLGPQRGFKLVGLERKSS